MNFGDFGIADAGCRSCHEVMPLRGVKALYFNASILYHYACHLCRVHGMEGILRPQHPVAHGRIRPRPAGIMHLLPRRAEHLRAGSVPRVHTPHANIFHLRHIRHGGFRHARSESDSPLRHPVPRFPHSHAAASPAHCPGYQPADNEIFPVRPHIAFLFILSISGREGTFNPALPAASPAANHSVPL